jgi:pimeloyl-ACP methyl ester carboxylesterase
MVHLTDATLEVYEAGQGGVPIVLCHGWPEHAYSYRHQVSVLVERGYHCIVPNQRGYGASSRPANVADYDIHHLTGDLVALLDHYGFEDAIFIGHDWGAINVWNLALLHPHRVRAIANLSVPFRAREASDPVAFWTERLGEDFYIVHFNHQPGVAERVMEADVASFLKRLYRTEQWLSDKRPMSAKFWEQEPGTLPGKLMMSDAELQVFVDAFERGGLMAPCHWYRNFTRNWETTAGIRQTITQPTLMIYGAFDTVPQLDMRDTVPQAEIHTLPCGHWIQQEEPEATNALLLAWLDSLVRS